MILLFACAGGLEDAPYVLTAGLGEVRSITPDGRGHLVIATPDGVAEVGSDGRAMPRTPGPALAVTAHPRTIYVLRDGVIEWSRRGAKVPGAIDAGASWGDDLMVLTPTSLEAIDVVTGERALRAEGLVDARAVALGPEGTTLVVTATQLLSVGKEGSTVLASGLTDARAAAMDGVGRIFVVHGAPLQLWRLDDQLVPVAGHLGDVRDMHFGSGESLPGDTLYIATGTGSIDYLRLAGG